MLGENNANKRKNWKYRLQWYKTLFKKRAEKFQESNPYSVTMYQDNNEEIVRQRNKRDRKLMPLLHMEKEAKVLDVACGIGRWADALPEDIKEYCGMDFSEELVAIANKRNHRNRFLLCRWCQWNCSGTEKMERVCITGFWSLEF